MSNKEITVVLDKVLEKFERLVPVQVETWEITGKHSREWYYTPNSIQQLFAYLVALKEAYLLIEEAQKNG